MDPRAKEAKTTSPHLDEAADSSVSPTLVKSEKRESPASISVSSNAGIEKAHRGVTNQEALGRPQGPTPSIRSRISRRTTSEGDSARNNEFPSSAEKVVREQVEEQGLIRRTPLYRHPVRGRAEKWHEEVDTPSQWTSLFYGESRSVGPVTELRLPLDLVVVAVLTVFGLTHDLSRPGAIPIFLG
jgi:hypothetical protein